MKMLWPIIPIYFVSVWFIPWHEIKLIEPLSSVYIFELALCFFCFHKLKLRSSIVGQVSTKLPIHLFFTAVCAFIIVASLSLFGVKSPFHFLIWPMVHLIIIAPLIEELIFRYIFSGVFSYYQLKPNHRLILNSLLFSLSHGVAFLYLPKDYWPFITIQLLYTFFLGWICTKARLQFDSLLAPIAHHFVFNLVFYLYLFSWA